MSLLRRSLMAMEDGGVTSLKLLKIVEIAGEVTEIELDTEVTEVILYSPSLTVNASYTGIGINDDFSWTSGNITIWTGATEKPFFAKLSCRGNGNLETEVVVDKTMAHRRIIQGVVSDDVIKSLAFRTNGAIVGQILHIYGR